MESYPATEAEITQAQGLAKDVFPTAMLRWFEPAGPPVAIRIQQLICLRVDGVTSGWEWRDIPTVLET